MEEARENFENQWQEAFEGAEMDPPNHVWNSVDAVLASRREAGYKRKIIFFKWVAAASVFVAVTSGVAVWFSNFNEQNQLAENKEIQETQNAVTLAPKNGAQASAESGFNGSTENGEKIIQAGSIEIEDPKETFSDHSTIATIISEPSTQVGDNEIVLADDHKEAHLLVVPPLTEDNAGMVAVFLLEEIDRKDQNAETALKPWKAEFLYLVPDLSAGSKKSQSNDFGLWAGLSLGSGSFDPGLSRGNSAFAAASADALDLEDAGVNAVTTSRTSVPSQQGSALSMGLDVGSQVSDRVMISGGVHYLNVSAQSAADLIATNTQSNESLALFRSDLSNSSIQNGVRDGSIVVSNMEVDVTNRLNYLSVPFKAGYIVVDNKVNLILNSGLVTNFLINSQAESASSGVGLFNVDSNDNAFKNVYFNLLTSVEVGYRFKNKYYLSIEPNYRRSISSFTTEESSYTGRPSRLGVSVGMKYIF